MKKTSLVSVWLVFSLTACVVGPDYQKPFVPIPVAFKEADGWKLAQPQDEKKRSEWWVAYHDAQLNTLMKQVLASNQNIAVATAQYQQAQAMVQSARAAYWPTIGGDFSESRAHSAPLSNSTTTNRQSSVVQTAKLALSASWEADVWGKIRRSVESSEASATASKADWQSAVLSAQALLAQTWFQMRMTEAQKTVLDTSVSAYERSLTITQNRYRAGVVSREDVAQAQTQLNNTRAQSLALGIQRAQYEHAIAVLIGKPPAELSIAPNSTLPTLPVIPTTLPSSLLERRPDVAAAERRMAAANADIGVAQAAFFPALSLGASVGYQNSSMSNLVAAPHRFWSVGPSLALTLFDGGALSAQKKSAIANYDKTVAQYRQTVLTAFQEVEDNLVALRLLAEQQTAQQAAAQSAEQSLTLMENRYRAGTVSYLDVVTAQVTALNAQRSALSVVEQQMLAHVALVKALGGNELATEL